VTGPAVLVVLVLGLLAALAGTLLARRRRGADVEPRRDRAAPAANVEPVAAAGRAEVDRTADQAIESIEAAEAIEDEDERLQALVDLGNGRRR
jgi:hypothetical protein